MMASVLPGRDDVGQVTFIEAMDRIMPTFDPEIARVAERLLIKPRAIDYRTGVFASKVTPGRWSRPILILTRHSDICVRWICESMTYV